MSTPLQVGAVVKGHSLPLPRLGCIFYVMFYYKIWLKEGNLNFCKFAPLWVTSGTATG